MRIVVVDDSAFMRRAITQMLTSDPSIEVVGAAHNGREGLEMVQRLKPDVVTLDIQMPEMDGLTALQHIMRECPTPVLMLSSLTVEGSHAALRALSLGAADVLAKDTSQISLSITNIQEDLLARVRAIAGKRPARRGVGASPAAPAAHPGAAAPAHRAEPESIRFRPGQFDIICIGSSTGGPPILELILSQAPASLAAPIVVAQHMPAIFTASMAERLASICRLPVHHAQDRMPLDRRSIYIAPGGRHTHIHKVGPGRWELRVNDEPASAIYRPSVDALFHSAAEAVGPRGLGIVLTGMGADGLEGGRALREKGGLLLAQSAESCVVYGMPKAVTEHGLVAASLAPEQIARALRTLAPATPPATAPAPGAVAGAAVRAPGQTPG